MGLNDRWQASILGRLFPAGLRLMQGVNLKRRYSEPLVLFAVLTVLFAWVYRDIYHGRPLLIGDLTPWFQNPDDAWRLFVSAWSNTNLGWANPLLSGMATVQIATSFLTGDPSAGQRLFYLSLMPLSVVSMYLLLRYLVSSSATRIIIAFAYGINGMSITWFELGAFPFLSVWASFPLVLLFFLKYLRDSDHRVRNILIFTSIIAFEAGIQPYFILRVSPMLVLVLLLELAQRRSLKYAATTAVGLLAAGAVYFVLTAPFTLTNIQDVFAAVTGASGGTIGSVSSRDINETVRVLVENYNTPYSLQLIRYSLYLVAGVVLLGYLLRAPERRWLYLGFAFLAVAVLGTMYSISLGKGVWVFEKLPFLLVLKEPSKLMGIMLQAIFLGIALLMEDMSRRRVSLRLGQFSVPHAHAWIGTGVLIGGLFFIVTEAHPPYDNQVTNLQRFLTTGFERRIDAANTPTYEVPAAFDKAAAWIRERRESEGFFRTVWLPSGRTIDRNLLPIYDPPSFRKPDDPMLTRFVLEPLYTAKTRNLGTRLGPFGVKYIVVPNPTWEWERWKRDTTGPPRYIVAAEQGFVSVGDPAEYLKALSNQEDLALVHSGDTFSVFENLRYLPHFSAYTKTLAIAPFELIDLPVEQSEVLSEFNMLVNGEFVDGLDGWKLDLQPGVEIRAEPLAEEGSSLRITVANKPLYGAASQTLAARDDAIYRLSARVRSDNATRASFRIYYLDGDGIRIPDSASSYQRFWFPVAPEASDKEFLLVPPSGTRNIRIYAEATYGVPGAPATTWFESLRLRISTGGLVAPLSNTEYVGTATENLAGLSPSLENVPKLLRSLPYVQLDDTLILIGDLAKAEPSEIANVADAVVFLGNPKLTEETDAWVVNATAVMMVYEAESAVQLTLLNSGRQEEGKPFATITRGEEFSYLGAVEMEGRWQASLEIAAPRAGFYRVLVRGELEGPKVILSGFESPALPMPNTMDGLPWFQTSPTFLGKGRHRLSLDYEGLGAVIDQIVVIQTSDPETDVAKLLTPGAVDLDVIPRSYGEYDISIKSDGPFTLLFREAYHSGWTATESESTLGHLALGPLGWANGFYSPTGSSHQVTVKFDRQDQRKLIIGVWAISWALVALAILLLIIPRPFRPNGDKMVRVLGGLATGAWRWRADTKHLSMTERSTLDSERGSDK